MKRNLLIVSILCLSAALVGCSSMGESTAPKPPAPASSGTNVTPGAASTP